jgi:hypothetical protein
MGNTPARNASLNVLEDDLARILREKTILNETKIYEVISELSNWGIHRNIVLCTTVGAYRNLTKQDFITQNNKNKLFLDTLHSVIDDFADKKIIPHKRYSPKHIDYKYIEKAFKNADTIYETYKEVGDRETIYNLYLQLTFTEMGKFFIVSDLSKYSDVVTGYLTAIQVYNETKVDKQLVESMILHYNKNLKNRYSEIYSVHEYKTQDYPFFVAACMDCLENVSKHKINKKSCEEWIDAQFEGLVWAKRPPRAKELTGDNAIDRFHNFKNKE